MHRATTVALDRIVVGSDEWWECRCESQQGAWICAQGKEGVPRGDEKVKRGLEGSWMCPWSGPVGGVKAVACAW